MVLMGDFESRDISPEQQARSPHGVQTLVVVAADFCCDWLG